MRKILTLCLLLVSLPSLAADPVVRCKVVSQGGAVRVREEPSEKGKLQRTLPSGAEFIGQKSGEWYRILSGSAEMPGYISGKFVQASAEPVQVLRVKAGGVRVRSTSSEDGHLLGTLKKGETFVGEDVADWYEIQDGPHKGGFVASQFVEKVEAAPTP
jgi:uncharacterized protein YgiM (DUF1202 family)